MDNKRILYISYDGMTDPLGQSQVLPYLTGLSKMGYRFTLVSCEKPDAFIKRRTGIEDICREHEIEWHPLPYTKWPPVISTILDLRRMKKRCKNILKNTPHDIVHCRSYISAIIGLEIKKKYGLKFIFDMRGFWADERVDGGLWPKKHLLYSAIYRFFKRQESCFLHSADYIITLTERAKEELLSWPHISRRPLPVQVIPCCADLHFFNFHKISENERLELRKRYGLSPDTLVIGYLGSLGTWYMIKEMVLLFKIILSQYPDSIFLVVSNDYPDNLSTLMLENNIPASHVIVTNAIREKVPVYLSVFDIGLFFIRPTYSKRGSSPVKHGEMMGMGIPLICNPGVGDVDTIVRSTASGYIIHDFLPHSLENAAGAIVSLKNIPREQIRKGAFQYYNLEDGINKYADIYQTV